MPADVSPSRFVLPDGLFIRYDVPDPRLAEVVSGYHVYTAESCAERVDWFLPGTADLCILLDAGPVSLTIRRRTYDPLPAVSLIGPTSQAMRAITRGGTLIGVGLTPLGWSRIARGPARDARDRLMPLTDVAPRLAEALLGALMATDRNAEVKPALDAVLLANLRPAHPDAAQVRRLAALILDDRVESLSALTRELDLPAHTLRRLASRHFGFPPKLLLLRARFLRSFVSMALTGDTLDYAAISPRYHDVSHFLRDARTFLGATPRRFLAGPTTFLQGSLHARAAALGAAVQVPPAEPALDAPRPAP